MCTKWRDVMAKSDFEVDSHVFVPKHELLSETERKELMNRYVIAPGDLPKILITDPAIRHLSIKEGDIIKITRPSPTAGTAHFFRVVVNN